MWQITRYHPRFADTAELAAKPRCLLLSGWSMNADVFAPLLPGLAQRFDVYQANWQPPNHGSLNEAVALLGQQIEQPIWLIGWSLGGNIAIALANQKPDAVLGVMTCATTPVFVKHHHESLGMPKTTFTAFYQHMACTNGHDGLTRFDALQMQGDIHHMQGRRALKAYRKQQQPWAHAALMHTLGWLEHLEQTQHYRQITVPVLALFAVNDAMVNADTAREITTLNPLISPHVLPDASHACIITHTQAVLLHCFNWINH